MDLSEFVPLNLKGFENCYLISRSGEVWSFYRERLLKKTTRKGYYRIKLKKGKEFSLHRLLAKTFIPNPENKQQINHIDGNKQNNKLENLEWVTCVENNQHSLKLGLRNHTRKSTFSKLNDNKVKEIKKLLKENLLTCRKIGELFGVERHVIQDIKSRRTWKHI